MAWRVPEVDRRHIRGLHGTTRGAILGIGRSAYAEGVAGVAHVVRAGSEIDLLECPALSASLRVRGPADVELECEGIQFIDSSGLLTLLEAQEALAVEGRRLILRDPSAPLERLLELTGLREQFDIHQS